VLATVQRLDIRRILIPPLTILVFGRFFALLSHLNKVRSCLD
jgi:hypothetical protein